ncbi:MAG: hypothetical protein QXS23_04925 [Desulfurococcaceae archaeon]
MNIYCGEKKHPGGKLIKICIKLSGDVVKGVLLTGDFFLEPEEEFERLKTILLDMDTSLNNVVDAVINAISQCKLRFYGIDISDIREAVEKAVEAIKMYHKELK